ncbi:MAG TPA: hypothetical protein VF782_05450 [Allosphingosinicella sp.]|jgi:hypothetical protein
MPDPARRPSDRALAGDPARIGGGSPAGAERRAAVPGLLRRALWDQGGVWLPKYDKAGIRAALVRALLQARRRDLPAAPAPGGPSKWYSTKSGSPPAPADGAALVAAELGACLAGKHWAEVLAIVRAVDPETERLGFFTGSPKVEAAHKREAAAVDAELSRVIPSISGCVPAGAKIRINRLRLRSLLEETAYQMMKAAGPAAGAGAHSTSVKPPDA